MLMRAQVSQLTNPVKIKLQGCSQEVEEIIQTLRRSLVVLEDSGSYQNFQDVEFVKRYLTVRRFDEGDEEETSPLISQATC